MSERSDTYIIMWDSLGLEYIANVSAMERAAIDDVLNDRVARTVPLNSLLMRARFNSQRHYEIYMVESELTEDEIIAHFDTDPQNIVDVIRRVGKKVFGEGAETDFKIR